jgi:hypothetical protein
MPGKQVTRDRPKREGVGSGEAQADPIIRHESQTSEEAQRSRR